MKTIRQLLRQRKQSDITKIKWLLCLLACSCLGISIYRGIQLYKWIHTSVIYELEVPNDNRGTVLSVQELNEMEDVTAVTEVIESEVQIRMNGKVHTYMAQSVSREYMEAVYGGIEDSAMPVFYMNHLAFSMVGNDVSGNELQCKYNEEESGKAAKLVLSDVIENDEPRVFIIDNSLNLRQNRTGLLICFSTQDLDGLRVKQIEQFGYRVKEELQIRCNTYEKTILWIQLRNSIILGIVYLFFFLVLKVYIN